MSMVFENRINVGITLNSKEKAIIEESIAYVDMNKFDPTAVDWNKFDSC
jgi:hypothetical protein